MLANDSFEDANAAVTATGAASHGSVVINPDNTVTANDQIDLIGYSGLTSFERMFDTWVGDAASGTAGASGGPPRSRRSPVAP